MVNEKTDMCILIGTLDSIYVYENIPRKHVYISIRLYQ